MPTKKKPRTGAPRNAVEWERLARPVIMMWVHNDCIGKQPGPHGPEPCVPCTTRALRLDRLHGLAKFYGPDERPAAHRLLRETLEFPSPCLKEKP